mgnify:CR=1 FL=1
MRSRKPSRSAAGLAPAVLSVLAVLFLLPDVSQVAQFGYRDGLVREHERDIIANLMAQGGFDSLMEKLRSRNRQPRLAAN